MCTRYKREHPRGFTLLETLIAISIFVIIAGTLISQNRIFQSNVETGNLAYEIALAIREAQVLGLGVRQFGGVFTTAYGIRLEEPNTNSASFILFLDRTSVSNPASNVRYDGPTIDPTVETFELRGGNQIVEVCGTRFNGSSHCSTLSGGPLRCLTIVFQRPDPAAKIGTRIGGGGPPCGNTGGSFQFDGLRASVRIRSLGDVDYTVEVTDTGQISVRQ
ncbi:MAG: type II secretion system protein [bacterium]|nr:type II secretion system protein [bacterium]MDZ4285242.1 type II secretion system protein [Patescibacteria group bacterium]